MNNARAIETTELRVRQSITSHQKEFPESLIARLSVDQIWVIAKCAAAVIAGDQENLLPLVAAALPFNLSRGIGGPGEDARRERAVDDAIRDATLTLAKVSGTHEAAPQQGPVDEGGKHPGPPMLATKLRRFVAINGWVSLGSISGDDLKEFFKWFDALQRTYSPPKPKDQTEGSPEGGTK